MHPPELLRAGIKGRVELLVRVGIDGKPLSVRVHRSSGHAAFDASARETVLGSWKFRPAVRSGQPEPAEVIVPIAFVIR